MMRFFGGVHLAVVLAAILVTAEGTVSVCAQPVIRLGAAAATNDAPRTRPSLIARTRAAQRGGTVEIALRLRLDPGWHVYWINPGDAGLAPKLKWTLPDGAAVSEIDWPAPRYHKDEHGLITYLYEGDVVLPLRLTLDEGFAGDRIELGVDATWLVCRDVCLPGKARLSLTLPVTDAASAVSAALTDAFAAADARRPVDHGPGAVQRVEDPAGFFSLDVAAGLLGVFGEGGDVVARIMPVEPGLVDESALHATAWTRGGKLRVTAPRAAPDAAPSDAAGFVELRHGDRALVLRFGPRVTGLPG